MLWFQAKQAPMQEPQFCSKPSSSWTVFLKVSHSASVKFLPKGWKWILQLIVSSLSTTLHLYFMCVFTPPWQSYAYFVEKETEAQGSWEFPRGKPSWTAISQLEWSSGLGTPSPPGGCFGRRARAGPNLVSLPVIFTRWVSHLQQLPSHFFLDLIP